MARLPRDYAWPADPSGTEALIETATGRTVADLETGGPFCECWLACGRRSGKSTTATALAVHLATGVDWRPCLRRGEVGLILLLASDREQAGRLFASCRGMIMGHPRLRSLVTRETQDCIELSCAVAIQVATSSFRAVGGATICAALLDEVRFWPSDDGASRNPDAAVVLALRPGLATLRPHSVLIGLSSPYWQQGMLYAQHQRYHGKAGARVLAWRADTMTMHPGFDPAEIAEAMEDAEATASEYGALFRSDVSRLFAREVLAASVDQGVAERPYDPRHEYVGFCDPSGGNGRDGFTLGIAHVSHGSNVAELDVCREIAPPLNPQETIREFCDLLTQ